MATSQLQLFNRGIKHKRALAKVPIEVKNGDRSKPILRTDLDVDLYAFSQVGGNIEVFAVVQVSLSLVAEDSALILSLHEVEEFLIVGSVRLRPFPSWPFSWRLRFPA